MSDESNDKNLPGVSQGRMGKLQRRVDKLQRESNEQQVLLNGLEKRFQQFEKYQSNKGIIFGLDRIEKAIRESGSGGGITQQQIDAITAQVIANREKIHGAQETEKTS